MHWFLIELHAADGWTRTYVVQDKTYEGACGRVQKLDGDGTFKLLGLYEKSEVDPKILKRQS